MSASVAPDFTMKAKYWITAFFLLALLAGCSSTPQQPYGRVTQPHSAQVQAAKKQWIARNLNEQYQQWRGTRYQPGGLSKRGVDCSGFVYLTFKSRFGMELPRSTVEQAQLGRPVAKHQLQTGDLVFFRIGRYTRHVGVYLDQGQFLHASTSKGVMISRLDEEYWRSAYWQAKRIQS